MLEELINNRRMLTDEQEIKIVEHYVHQGKNLIIIIACNNVIFTHKNVSGVEIYIIRSYL